MLDGVGAGFFGALFPIVVADVTEGMCVLQTRAGRCGDGREMSAALSNTLLTGLVMTRRFGS
jgi:hypothetical protein